MRQLKASIDRRLHGTSHSTAQGESSAGPSRGDRTRNLLHQAAEHLPLRRRPATTAPKPAEQPLPRFPAEIWQAILTHLTEGQATDPAASGYRRENLQALLALGLASRRLGDLVQPQREALGQADRHRRLPPARNADEAIAALEAFSEQGRLDIPMAAYLRHGVQHLVVEPSGPLPEPSRRSQVRASLGGLRTRLRGASAEPSSSAATGLPYRGHVLDASDMVVPTGPYRERLEQLKLQTLERLWPVMEQAWPDRPDGRSRPEWAASLAAISDWPLAPDRKVALLTGHAWPQLSKLEAKAINQPLEALLMNPATPLPLRDQAVSVLLDEAKVDCAQDSHAKALGALALQFGNEPLAQRMELLERLLGADGALSRLPPENLALACVPLAHMALKDMDNAMRGHLFDQFSDLSRRLPRGSEMYRLMPRSPYDDISLVARLHQVQQHAPGRADDADLRQLRGHFDLASAYGRIDEPLSLTDARQMVHIAQVSRLVTRDVLDFYLASHAQAIGSLRDPDDREEGLRALLEAVHRTPSTKLGAVLQAFMEPEGHFRPSVRGPLHHTPPERLPTLLSLLAEQLDSPEVLDPRRLIRRMEVHLAARPDAASIRASVRPYLAAMVDRHPFVIGRLANPGVGGTESVPLSKFWR